MTLRFTIISERRFLLFMSFFKNLIQSLFQDEIDSDSSFVLPEVNPEAENKLQPEDLLKNKNVYPNIDVNLEYINVRFNSLINSDIKIREFLIHVRNKQYKAFIIYIDGMSDNDSINDFILKPLMLKNNANSYDGPQVISEAVANNISVRRIKKFNVSDYIMECLLPQNDVKRENSFDNIADSVVSGNCVLFIDTLDYAFDISTKKYETRSIGEPKNEPIIRGSQEAFVENLRTNTSMLRRNLSNENLVIENLTVGKVEKNKCAVCYLKNIANADLVAEVKYRLNNIDVDYCLSVGELEQFIKDDIDTTLPEAVQTERVDRATSYLLQGRVVIVYNGCPYVLVVPITIFDFLKSQEDTNINYVAANLLKIIRAISFVITLLLPSLYIAISTYHSELLPTDLLFSIVASRSSVPFMIIIEILIMEVSFEIIREAGLRVASPMGQTVGIVGTIVLGQAAVDASIVSPILIIIVAITGITSFAVLDISLSFHLRIARFAYTILGALAGFLGIAVGLFIHLSILCSLKSFGVPYLAPYAPLNVKSTSKYLLRPAWKREFRDDYLASKRPRSQSKISLKWRNRTDQP